MFHCPLNQHVPKLLVCVAKYLTAGCLSIQGRGLKQALLARGPEEDLTCLLDQPGNYKFQHITHVSNGSDELAPGEPLSNERLKRICTNWALPPKQVMVVIGGGAQGEAALAATEDSGFFVCRVNNSSHEAPVAATPAAPAPSPAPATPAAPAP
ncbi:hypothetical protein M758_4G062100 [Ceratodon purpureus]|nr:hypothetical protein M758_N024700 [Ceratodon purpureus]KAG0618411.1 hypothetical protein M758_4G061900 [Ceratodon purpureus]KAG0618413.1 hypothetical protein M758_4G062100 [Ceratodon purpureus]